jgi:hypothetical protein
LIAMLTHLQQQHQANPRLSAKNEFSIRTQAAEASPTAPPPPTASTEPPTTNNEFSIRTQAAPPDLSRRAVVRTSGRIAWLRLLRSDGVVTTDSFTVPCHAISRATATRASPFPHAHPPVSGEKSHTGRIRPWGQKGAASHRSG